jgi:hypothetical protein
VDPREPALVDLSAIAAADDEVTSVDAERRAESSDEQDPVTGRFELITLCLHTDLPPCAGPPDVLNVMFQRSPDVRERGHVQVVVNL